MTTTRTPLRVVPDLADATADQPPAFIRTGTTMRDVTPGHESYTASVLMATPTLLSLTVMDVLSGEGSYAYQVTVHADDVHADAAGLLRLAESDATTGDPLCMAAVHHAGILLEHRADDLAAFGWTVPDTDLADQAN